MKTYRYLIKGSVQGVAFRYYTLKKALEFNIRGTVQNLYNGNVEVYAQAETGDILLFEDFLNKGPSHACVRSVNREEVDYNYTFYTFEII